jgi:hypothetical protein
MILLGTVVAIGIGILALLSSFIVYLQNSRHIDVLRDEFQRSQRALYMCLHNEILNLEDFESDKRRQLVWDLIDRMGQVSDYFDDQLSLLAVPKKKKRA